jgi:CO/xanthine dehydrogenase Mo-binding subunit
MIRYIVYAQAHGGRRAARALRDPGHGHRDYTVLGQIAAELLGIPLARTTVSLGDTDLPEGPFSAGSMATASFTPAVESAATELRRRLHHSSAPSAERPAWEMIAATVPLPPQELSAMLRYEAEAMARLGAEATVAHGRASGSGGRQRSPAASPSAQLPACWRHCQCCLSVLLTLFM